jgi:phosphopantothenate-cysteine ligase
MKIILTSGGTSVPLDEVRRLTNISTGRFGAELGREILRHKHELTFIHAKHSNTPFTVSADLFKDKMHHFLVEIATVSGLRECLVGFSQYAPIEFDTPESYLGVVEGAVKLFKPDVFISAAAVSDYTTYKSVGKLSSDKQEMVIKLQAFEKVVQQIRGFNPKIYVVAFKLFAGGDNQQKEAAVRKVLETGNVDMVVANDIREIRKGHRILSVWALYNGCVTLMQTVFSAQELIEVIEKGKCNDNK